MKAIILAADKTNELINTTGDIPKSLIQIGGNTILEIQLNVLHFVGIDDVSVVVGYKKELFDIPGIDFFRNQQFENTGSLYSLFCAMDKMDDELLIIGQDVLFDKECLSKILDSKGDIVVTNTKNSFEMEESISDMNQISDVVILKCSKLGAALMKEHFVYFKAYKEDFKKASISELVARISECGANVEYEEISEGLTRINSEVNYYQLLKNSDGVVNVLGMSTDWALRATMYENIQWVNVNAPLEAMVELSKYLGGFDKKVKILDVGTGTGKVLEFFQKSFADSECYGVDISPDMMNKIDKAYGFILSNGNVEDLSQFQDDTFDIVTARMSMHHVNHLDNALNEINRVLKTNGCIVICEGVPPAKEALNFYKEVFSYKEVRNTFLTDDLINLLCNHSFKEVTSRTITVPDMSMNNWLVNAGIPYRNKDIIKNLHYECSEEMKKVYKMKRVKDDILMEWKFSVVAGIKK